MALTKASKDVLNFSLTTTNVNTVVANGAAGSYTIPANTILVMGTTYHYMGGNSGSRISVEIRNSAGTALFTYILTGGNENNGGDGGSGLSTRSAWSVAIPAAAQGGTLYFSRTSGSNSSYTVTVNQVVTTA
jgi:hypothetical protein